MQRNSVYEDLNEMRAKTAQALKTPPSIAKKPLPPVPDKPLPPIPDESSSLHDTDEGKEPLFRFIFYASSQHCSLIQRFFVERRFYDKLSCVVYVKLVEVI